MGLTTVTFADTNSNIVDSKVIKTQEVKYNDKNDGYGNLGLLGLLGLAGLYPLLKRRDTDTDVTYSRTA